VRFPLASFQKWWALFYRFSSAAYLPDFKTGEIALDGLRSRRDSEKICHPLGAKGLNLLVLKSFQQLHKLLALTANKLLIYSNIKLKVKL
jgi:hypothetical protein